MRALASLGAENRSECGDSLCAAKPGGRLPVGNPAPSRVCIFGHALSLLLIFVLTPTLALAGLGETESRCLDKFGPSVKQTDGSGVGEKLVYYEKGGVGIGVEFWKGRASCLFYKKTIRSEGLTDEEIDAFLAESKDDSFWEGAHIIGEGRRWARKDGKAVAHYNAQQKLLIIMTDAFAIERMKNKPPSAQ